MKQKKNLMYFRKLLTLKCSYQLLSITFICYCRFVVHSSDNQLYLACTWLGFLQKLKLCMHMYHIGIDFLNEYPIMKFLSARPAVICRSAD